MYSSIAAAVERHVPSGPRGTSLPVCMGAILVLVVLSVAPALMGMSSVAGLSALALGAVAVALLLTLQRVHASEGALRSVREDQRQLDQENAELRRFAMTVAHDLRAPLVTTAGFLNMAKESVEIGELDELLGLLDRAEAAAERMDGLISGILDLATDAKETVQEPIELDGAIDDALENLHEAISERGIEIRRDAPIGVALGDRRYVAQVFDNLLGNALKYGQPTDPRVRSIIEVRAEQRGEILRVSVGDNGPGIPAEKMGQVLARAADAEPGVLSRPTDARPTTGGNIGLGLGLVRQAMAECGGTLSLRTSSMGGAEFVLDFRMPPCEIASTPTTVQNRPTLAQHARHNKESEPQRRIPERLTRELISSHSCSSSRMMLTTG